jgi:predicted N-acetyltransferase YhbS
VVGFGRAISDGAFRALVDDVVVDASHRGQGLGFEIVKRLLTQLHDVDEVFLNTGPHLERYYGQFGFERFRGVAMKLSRLSEQEGLGTK